ncbi:hypothetical protein [Halosimplex halophilum]|uniref:hypothetical protein n=1 Tax=Halosimplex halophilum TaxID=2559572 RepID=UPI00107F9913|nr:hypothetical protein [Halosimplex halophilum]
MKGNKFGRRQFLQSTAAATLGISGGMAASGTATADDDQVEIFVWHSGEKTWDYRIYTGYGEDSIEKGVLADDNDKIASNGEYLLGTIEGNSTDNYWMDADDNVDKVYVQFADYGFIQLEVTGTDLGKATGITRDTNEDWPGYDYEITYDHPVRDHPRYTDDGQDESGNPAEGTVDPMDNDGFIGGQPRDIIFYHPEDSDKKLEINIRR